MKTRKIGIIASILLLALALPALSIPKVQAFDASRPTIQLSGLVVASYFDQFFLTTVEAAREGSTINFNAHIVASSTIGQRNITVGVRLDWMTNFVNASGARPTQTLPLNANQLAMVAVGVTIPTVSGFYSNINLNLHSWEVRVWSGPANTSITPSLGLDCPEHFSLSGCRSSSGTLAVYSNAQADGALARQQADPEIATLTNILGRLNQLPPGSAKASSELAQAKTEEGLGDTSYGQGDFAGAKTHYTNALNFANSAVSDLSTQGGGVDSATFWQLILNGTGVLLVGVGVVLAAVGSWMYLRKRSKATTLK